MSVPQDTAATVKLAIEALLRDHPDARVCALSDNGLIVPMPEEVPVEGRELIEGRALIDLVVAEDRTKVIHLWMEVRGGGSVTTRVRLLDSPAQRSVLHFLDMRSFNGLYLGIVRADDEAGDDDVDAAEKQETGPAAPRLCTLTEDEHANVLDCDEAFTLMCGYTREDVLGRSVLDQIHPDDQARAVESWLQMLSTQRDQHYRGRRKNKEGRWLWVDTTLHYLLDRPDSGHVLVELIDVSAEMAAQEALEEREELLRRLTDAMPVGLVQLDVAGSVVYHNAHVREIFQGTQAEVVAMAAHREGGSDAEASKEPANAPTYPALDELLSTLTERGKADFGNALAEVLDEGRDRDLEVDLEIPPGEWRRVLLNIRALLRAGEEVSGVIMCALDITDSARARRELERRATFDALTHLHNRSSILAALQHELDRGAFTGVIYVDLDRFKPVNDEWGHASGDELLCLVADRLAAAARRGDDVGRLGGDEFLVLLRDIPRPETAMHTALRISTSLASSFEISAGVVDLRASLGVACASPDDLLAQRLDAEELVKRADAAMYSSKAAAQGVPVLAA